MSSFTTIALNDGSEIQIKTGRDSCDTYKIGDTVEWHVDPDRPGYGTLLDGVYTGSHFKHGQKEGKYALEEFEDVAVAILNHKIHSVIPLPFDLTESKNQLGIKDPPRCWWSGQAWARKKKCDQKSKRDHIRYRRAVNGMSPEDAFNFVHGRYLRCILKEKGFARQFLRVIPLKLDDPEQRNHVKAVVHAIQKHQSKEYA